MKEHYHGHRDRLKQRYLKEPESLYDYEVIELLLGYVIKGRDVKPQAKELIERAGSLNSILGFDASKIKGLGKEADIFFGVMKELFSRIGYEDLQSESVVLDKPEKAASFLRYKIGYEDKEHFVALFLDINKNLISFKNLFSGTVDRLSVYPREIAEEAIAKKASFVLVSHNHPSGNLTPSEEDIKLTDKLINALDSLDIKMADHIIISKKGFYSFKREKVIV